MSSAEFQELHEQAEHARHNPDTAPVSLTMAVLAVVVAVVSLMGHRTHTEEVILQNRASDSWAHYQAKAIRLHEDQIVVDTNSPANAKDPAQADKVREKYSAEVERYREDEKELETEARKLEAEEHQISRRSDRFDLAEVFLEIGLVITSITLLSGKRPFWYGGMVLGLIGTAVAVSSFLLH